VSPGITPLLTVSRQERLSLASYREKSPRKELELMSGRLCLAKYDVGVI
jgi:hypothetical protein